MQQKRVLILCGSAIVLVITLTLAPMLGSEFLPKLDEGNIWLTINLPASSSLEKTEQTERQIRAILQSTPEVGNIISHVGRPDDGTDPKGPNNMEILMTALMAGLGLLPAALSHGIGSETQRPFAVAILDGIISATFFTLLLLPLAYPYFSGKTETE